MINSSQVHNTKLTKKYLKITRTTHIGFSLSHSLLRQFRMALGNELEGKYESKATNHNHSKSTTLRHQGMQTIILIIGMFRHQVIRSSLQQWDHLRSNHWRVISSSELQHQMKEDRDQRRKWEKKNGKIKRKLHENTISLFNYQNNDNGSTLNRQQLKTQWLTASTSSVSKKPQKN